MPNEVDDIVQNVVLTGNEEVAAVFEKMREAGERAFEAIGHAMEHSVFSFTGLTTALAGLVASVAITGVGLFEFVKSTSESVDELGDLAVQTGTTTEEMSGLMAAFAQGGVGAGELQASFKRLSVSIQQSWSEIRKASRESADQLKGDALSISNAELALADALRKAADVGRDQAIQSKQNVAGVAGARQALNELNAKHLASLGVDTSALDTQLAKNRDMLAIKQAQFALEQAKTKQAEDAANADKEALKVANAAEQAQLALNQARRKEDDDRKNDINNVTKAVKEVAEGNAGALNTINASAENIAKGIINSSKDSGKAIGELKGDITDLAAPGVKDTFLQIGKVLQNIEDPALKTAVAFRLLGRSVSQEFLNVLSDPAKIEEFTARIDKLKLGISEADEVVAKDFRSSLFTLQNDIQLVSVKLATAFGPGLTIILKSIDNALINNRQSIIDFAESVATNAVPVVESFIRVLTGAAEPRDQWLVNYIDKIKSFGSAIGDVVGIVVKAFTIIGDAATATANGLNKVFGTSLNAVDVLFGAWVVTILARFAIVQQAAQLLAGTILIAFSEAFFPVTLAIGALYALKAAFDAVKDFFGIGGANKSVPMLEGAEARLKAIAQILSGDIKGGIEAWTKAGDEQIKKEKELDDAYKKSSETRKDSTEAVLAHEKRANDEAVTSHKTAREKINEDSKSSADKRIDDLTRVSTANKEFTAEQKQQADTAKQAASSSTSKPEDASSSFFHLDENGIRNFGSDSTSLPQNNDIVPESIFASRWKAIFKEIAAKEGELEAQIQTDAIMGGSIGTRNLPNFVPPFGGRAEVIHPSVIEKPPLPRERPTEADLKPITEAIEKGTEKGTEKGVEKGIESPTNRPDSLTPPFSPPPGEFPAPPAQVPLAAELTPFKSLTDIGDKIQSILDGIANKTQGVLDSTANKLDINKEPVSPNAQENITSSFEALKSAFDSIVTILHEVQQNLANASKNLANTNKTLEAPASTQEAPATTQQKSPELQKSSEATTELFSSLKENISSFVETIKQNLDNLNKPPEQKPLELQKPLEASADFNILKDSISSFVSSFVETIKQNENINKPPETKAPEAPPPTQEAPQTQISTFESILNTLENFLNNTANKETTVQQNEQGGIGIRGDAEDKAAQSATQLAAAMDVATTAATQAAQQDQQKTDTSGAEQANQELQSTASSAQQASSALDSLASSSTTISESATTVSTSLESMSSSADRTPGPLQLLAAAAESAATALQSVRSDGSTQQPSSTVQAASGGWIRGPGGPTGDKIPALLSDEEYVHQAAATRFWSVPVMHAINNMDVAGLMSHLSSLQLPKFSTGGLVSLFNIDVDRVMNSLSNFQIPKFSAGGLVSLLSPSLPRFAAGGVVSTEGVGAMPHLGSVDLRTDHGSARVIVDKGGISQLRRAAVQRNIGKERQPSWVK